MSETQTTQQATGQNTEWAGPDRHYAPCVPDRRRHWGPEGAAGALCWTTLDGTPYVLLGKRSRHVQQGGTWAFPGGAIDVAPDGTAETPLQTASREFTEEIDGVYGGDVTAVIEAPCEHGCGWGYTTFLIRADVPGQDILPRVRVARGPSRWETDCVAWVPAYYVDKLQLHPGMVRTWPALRDLISAASAGKAE